VKAQARVQTKVPNKTSSFAKLLALQILVINSSLLAATAAKTAHLGGSFASCASIAIRKTGVNSAQLLLEFFQEI
jgi:hypothetical protein